MEKLLQIFKISELRKKIMVVVLMLVAFRFMASVPIPGIDLARLKDFFSNNQLFGLLNVLSGGGMSNFSIVLMGVGPYITASIIMQLMTMIVPQIEKLYREEGEAGRQKFNQITRAITVPIAILQGFSMIVLYSKQQIIPDLNPAQTASILVTVTAGTILLMWLGELITEKGIGNGVSLIIFAGIVSSFPATIQTLRANWDETKLLTYAGMAITLFVIVYVVVYITEGQRNIPVTYARRVRSGKVLGGSNTYLPLRVNQAGVIPIIFALSVLLFPNVIANFVATMGLEKLRGPAMAVDAFFNNPLYHGIFYFLLVAIFTFFYTRIAFDPKNISENLQKNGGYIPGIRPGKKTEEYLSHVVNRITLAGAVFLGFIAVLPFIVQSATQIQSFSVGGTSLLIVISVVIETIKQIEGQVIMRDYERI